MNKNTSQRLVNIDHEKKKVCSSSQGLSHKAQLFGAEMWAQGCWHASGSGARARMSVQ